MTDLALCACGNYPAPHPFPGCPVPVAHATPSSSEEGELVPVGWYCWRCHAINEQACRSDNVPIHVPREWVTEMQREIAARENGGEPDDAAPVRLSWAESVASHGTGPDAVADIDVHVSGQSEPAPLELPLDEARLLHAMLSDLLAEHAPASEPGLRERYAEAIREAACTGNCDMTEAECAKQRIQQVVWHRGRLAEVSGSPEMFADAVRSVAGAEHAALKRAHVALAEQAGKDQAALARVHAVLISLCREPHPSHGHLCPDDVRRTILTALDQPQEQP